MGVIDIYSKRHKGELRGDLPDVYQYNHLPTTFRTQVVFILTDLFSHDGGSWRNRWFRSIHNALAREFGVPRLHDRANNPWDEVLHFLSTTTNVDDALSAIELSFSVAESAQEEEPFISFTMTPSKAVEELNTRFLEHGIGYQLESNRIVRIDSKFLHQEAVKPVLQLLKAKHYAGANGEFRNAHEHFRHQRHSEAINECLKALESTLKVICKKREWPFSDKDPAKTLLAIIFEKGLVPGYLESKFTGLRTVLESGVPTIRNRESGHGAGEEPRHIPQHLAAYVIHLTASAIVFISRCDDDF